MVLTVVCGLVIVLFMNCISKECLGKLRLSARSDSKDT